MNRYYLQHSFCLEDFIIDQKDVIRLSMTTDMDVDCLNIITIRLSIVFGDCMQSAEVTSNVFYAIFSSPEPLDSQGELLVSL